MAAERFLQWRERLTACEALDGLHILTIYLNGKHKAGTNGFIVHQDRARSTHAHFAADVRSSQSHMVTNEIGQQKPRFDIAGERSPVDITGKPHRP